MKATFKELVLCNSFSGNEGVRPTGDPSGDLEDGEPSRFCLRPDSGL